jgi:hypothetical protein
VDLLARPARSCFWCPQDAVRGEACGGLLVDLWPRVRVFKEMPLSLNAAKGVYRVAQDTAAN